MNKLNKTYISLRRPVVFGLSVAVVRVYLPQPLSSCRNRFLLSNTKVLVGFAIAFWRACSQFEGKFMSNNSIAAPVNGRVTGAQIRIVAVVVLGAFLALLNQTVMSPALPVIMADFAIDASTAQWIMSIYPLVSGIMVPVSAFLIDKFSTRALFFGSIIVFALGTLLCAIAPDFMLLIVGRVLQAAGSGVLMPLVSVVPMLVFPVEKRGTAMGMAGIVMSAGPAVGPVVGGAVIDTYGWRASDWIYRPSFAGCFAAGRFLCLGTLGN